MQGDKAEGESEGDMPAKCVYSMDETCRWGDSAATTQVLGGKGKKNQYFVQKHSCESATLIVTTCANGNVLCPYCIFAASALKDEWTQDNPLNAV